MPITGEALHLQAQLDAALDQVLDDQVRDLVSGWALGWDEVAGDLNDTLEKIIARSHDGLVPASWFARSDRLGQVLGLIGRRLDTLAAASKVRILRDLSSVARQAAAAQAPILAAMLPDGHQLDGAPTLRALDSIINRVAQQITADHRPLSAEAYNAVRRELVRGVAVGINPRDTAQLMIDRAEGGFNGGLTRALTISRTEMVDAHRDAAQAGQDAHADVLTSWVWLAHLSPTTCRSCIAMNGTEHPIAEPGPLDHQQGRCVRMPKTKTWAELGIDIAEPASAVPDAKAFFDGLTVEQQRKILGREGYDAWRSGDFPMESWAQRRENDGWRDSIVPAKPSDPGDAAGAGLPPVSGGGMTGGTDGPPNGGPGGPDEPGDGDPFEHLPYGGWEIRHPDLSRLTDDEETQIAWYADAGYRFINEAMRGRRTMDDHTQHSVDAIHSGLAKYPLDRAIRVTRSTELEQFGISEYSDLPDLVGDIFDEPAFLSTSLAPIHPPVVFRLQPVYLEVALPVGTPALAITGNLLEPAQEHEQELLVIDARRLLVVRVGLDETVSPPQWRVWVQVLEA